MLQWQDISFNMAFFGNPNSFLGIDIGTSSLKLVELVGRKRRIELTAYAQAALENPLDDEGVKTEEVITRAAGVIRTMMDKAGTSSDQAVVALPASAVFTSVLEMPPMPEAEMQKAVEFAARDVVPAELEDIVLGYSRLGEKPHLAIKSKGAEVTPAPNVPTLVTPSDTTVPVFITAAPKYLVERYIALLDRLEMKLVALELETFPLVRSLLPSETASAMAVDIGDRATTYHIIDRGTPRVSYTAEYGGFTITEQIAAASSISFEEAEKLKAQHGLLDSASPVQKEAALKVVTTQAGKAKEVLDRYHQQGGRQITSTVLIGGGANLPGLVDVWQSVVGHKVSVGNPWRGLSYPQQLESRLQYLGPAYGVAVGLALRNFMGVADGNKEI